MIRASRNRALSRLFGLALLLGAWLLLAPAQLGGSVSYLVVAGESMEPEFSAGDLVLVREAAGYRIGDVAAYRSKDLRTIVLHRIVRQRSDRFVLRGDNNSLADPIHPRASELLGRPWLVVPGAGPIIKWIRKPINAAALSALAVLLGLGLWDARRERRPLRLRVPSEAVLGSAALAGALCLLFALFALAQPATRAVAGPPLYAHEASFGYQARVPSSAAYPRGVVLQPDPVFLRLVRAVSVRFDYRLASTEPAVVHGTAGLALLIRGANDWQRTIALAPSRPFRGARLSLGGRLDLREVRSLAEKVERLTGTRSDSYELALLPRVDVRGTVGTEPLAETYAPRLLLRLDPLELRLDRDRRGNALSRSQARGTTRAGPNVLSLPGLHVKVVHARLAAVPGIVLMLLAALLWLAPVGRPARIRSRYGTWLVDVAPRPTSPAAVIEVRSMDDLVRLAEHHGRAILHEEDEQAHQYVVEDDGRAYVHTVAEAAEDSAVHAALAAR